MSLALRRTLAPCLRLYLCGPMQAVDAAGNSVLPRTRKARALLAILALASPKAVSRENLSLLLWSKRGREQARGSLRQCIHELQTALQSLSPGILEADREQVRLSEEAIWVDAKAPGAERAGILLEDLAGLDPAFRAWVQSEQLLLAAPAPGATSSRGTRILVRSPKVVGPIDGSSLAEGIAQDVMAALSRFRWLACVSADQLNTDAIASDYVLDGTIRQFGDQLRVTLRVEDARSAGEIVWARNFEGSLRDPFVLLESIATQAAAQIDPELLLCEGRHAAERLSKSSSSGDLSRAAIPGILTLEREGFDRAGAMLAEAARLRPDDATTHAWLAHWFVLAVGQGWAADPESAVVRAGQLAERAVTLESADARSLTIAGHVQAFLNRRADKAIGLHDRALALNPSLSLAWVQSGLAHCYRGEHLEAIRRIEMARYLSPFDPHGFFFDMALTMPYSMLGDFTRSAALGRLTAQLKPGFSSTWKGLLLALGHLGRADEAAEVLARLLSLEPGFSVQKALARSPLQRPEDLSIYAEGLRRGGLPEE